MNVKLCFFKSCSYSDDGATRPFQGIRAWKNFIKTQQLEHAFRCGSEIKDANDAKIAKKRSLDSGQRR